MPRLPADFDVAAVQFVEGLLEELQGQGLRLALANPSHQVGTAWWQVVVALDIAQDEPWLAKPGGRRCGCWTAAWLQLVNGNSVWHRQPCAGDALRQANFSLD